MKAIQPYLNFDGNAREAMTFYQSCLGGQLEVQRFADVKAPGPPGSEIHDPLAHHEWADDSWRRTRCRA